MIFQFFPALSVAKHYALGHSETIANPCSIF